VHHKRHARERQDVRVVTRVVRVPAVATAAAGTASARTASVSTVPQGGVQAGAGGTATDGGNAALAIGAGLLLVATAGGFALRRRVTE
jgi:hypothetical protein